VWLVEQGVGSNWIASLTPPLRSWRALTLDEFALWLNLQDVYWTGAGRESIYAVIIFISLLSVGIWGGPFLREVVGEFLKVSDRRQLVVTNAHVVVLGGWWV